MTNDDRHDQQHQLPAGVGLARGDVEDDPVAAEQRGTALLATSGTAILEGVEQQGAAYAASRATGVLDAWGRVTGAAREDALARLHDAAAEANRRVLGELRALLALDPSQQRRTPLEIVRTLGREPSEVLAALGVPEVVRDVFEERALPDDPYGLAPRTLTDLGDSELGAMLLVWGVGKATVLRARAAAVRDERSAPAVENDLSKRRSRRMKKGKR